MAEFEIQRSQAVPEAVRMPRASLNVDTGAGILGEATAKFGEALGGLGADIYKRESAAEYSELKRRVDEAGFATFNSVSGDEKTDNELWKKFEVDLQKLQSQKANVNAAVKEHINEVIPNWRDNFNKKHLAIRQVNAHTKFNFEYENLLSLGDVVGATKILDFQFLTKDISEQEFASRKDRILTDSFLAQSERLINLGDPSSLKRAEGILANFSKLKTTDEKPIPVSILQLEKANKLQGIVQRQSKQNSDSAEIEIMSTLHKNKNASPVERKKIGEQMLANLPKSGISAERYGVMLNRVEDFQEGADIESDRIIFTTLRTEILQTKSTNKDIAIIREKIYENTDKLSATDFKGLMDLCDNKMSKMQAFALSSLTKKYNDEKSGTGYAALNLPEFQIAMEQWVEENPKSGYKEIWGKGMEMMADWDMRTPEELMGEMTGGGETIPIIATDEDYDALPSGSQFIDPDGQTRRKP